MTPHPSISRGARPITSWAPLLAFALAALSLILLAAAPFGWRSGLLSLKTSFLLLACAGPLAVGAAILAALGLIFARVSLGWARIALLSGILLLGIAAIAVPGQLRRNHAPPINDITTDMIDPPPFVAVLAERRAEDAGTEVYAGPVLARQQKAAYPDIAPLILPMAAARAYEIALGTAKTMPGWHVIAIDPAAGRIEATQTSFWFGFTDDVVIRVTGEGNQTRIDMRSHSRQGRGDLGVNAARIRRYMAALRSATSQG